MTIAQDEQRLRRKPLRLWPGVVLAAFIILVRFILPVVAPNAEIFDLTPAMLGVLGGAFGGLAILLWWLLFSRSQWRYRLGAIVVLIAAAFATSFFIDISIANGHMGYMFPIYVTPLLGLALVAAAAAGRGQSARGRWTSLAVAAVVACAAMTLVRTGGITGDGAPDLHWRWSDTPEQRLLAHASSEPAVSDRATATPPTSAPAPPDVPKPTAEPKAAAKRDAAPVSVEKESDPDRPISPEVQAAWPGFRGRRRDSIIRSERIATDWAASPPVEMWRRPVGPAWSSFAVAGDLIYTQEQRGEDEIVSCYRLSTGEPVWKHRDRVRFWESNAGAGPRATPTWHGGRVYTMGGTGLVNALDARTGAVVWSRNAAADTGKETPVWGFTSSPLVIGDVVIIAAAGRLVAYDAATGKQRWIGQTGGGGYSSPHPAVIDGVSQVVLQRGARTVSVSPADGTPLWEHMWVPSASIVQPALPPEGGVVITTSDAMGGQGMRYLSVTRGSSGWSVQERWTSRGLKPYFNDFVVHKGHVFGFDNNILSCVDLQTGERKWKGGRYGNGQLLLLADQDVLLVLSEDGELALVSATADKFAELARVPAIEGKTWNHPVLVGGVLLVRNSEEMAAFRLQPASH